MWTLTCLSSVQSASCSESSLPFFFWATQQYFQCRNSSGWKSSSPIFCKDSRWLALWARLFHTFDFYKGSIQRTLLILTSLWFPSSTFSGVIDTSTQPHPAGDVRGQEPAWEQGLGSWQGICWGHCQVVMSCPEGQRVSCAFHQAFVCSLPYVTPVLDPKVSSRTLSPLHTT